MRSRGFSLISVLVSIVITGIFATTISSTIVFQNRGMHSLSRKLDILATDSFIFDVLGAEETCTCQLGGKIIDTSSLPNIPDIYFDLGILRSGCDTNNPDNIIVQMGQPLKNATALDIMVDSIRVTNIVPTGTPDSYEGDLVVEYTVVNGSVRPSSISMIMFIDSSSGTPTNRPIKECIGSGGSLNLPCSFTDETTQTTLMGCGDTVAAGGRENTFLGLASGPGSTGIRNTFVGALSGNANTLGTLNTYIGTSSGENNEGTLQNTFLGFQSGSQNETENLNVIVGADAGQASLKSSNVFLGFSAGHDNEESDNVFVGSEAGSLNSSGVGNTFVGYKAGSNGPSIERSVFLGAYAGDSSTSQESVFIGFESGKNSVQSKNVFAGAFSGKLGTSNRLNTFLGHSAGKLNNSNLNTYVGQEAGELSTGAMNVLVGQKAGGAQVIGNANVFVGQGAGESYNGLDPNFDEGLVFVGQEAGSAVTGGTENVFLGQGAAGGTNMGSGMQNTFVGQEAGFMAAGTSYNTFVGQASGKNSTSGLRNVFFGQGTGLNNEGSDNTFIGYESGKSNTVGQENTFVGYSSGKNNTTGSYNTFLGHQSGQSNTIGESNVFIGMSAGENNTTGSYNTFVGYAAGQDNTTGSSNVFIGDRGYPSYNNKFVLGQIGSDKWLTGDITSSGNLAINGLDIQVTSSRTLKKNIIVFENYEESLQDILRTPLYNYRYKNKKDFPEKVRRGIISEELPDHLQLKPGRNKGVPSQPDWPSIYGTFWASIKALYNHILQLEEVLSEYRAQIEPYQQSFLDLIFRVQEDLVGLDEEISIQIKDLTRPSEVFQQTVNQFKKDREQLLMEISREREEIKEIQKQLQKAQEKMSSLL